MYLLLITQYYNTIKQQFFKSLNIQESLYNDYTIIQCHNTINNDNFKQIIQHIYLIDKNTYLFGLIEDENYNYAFLYTPYNHYDLYYYNDYDDYEDEIDFGTYKWVKTFFYDKINDIELITINKIFKNKRIY